MILRKGSVPAEHSAGPPWPERIEPLARAAGMRAMGFNIVTLLPGQRSSTRHWHTHSDEALYVLEGRLSVIEDDGAHDIGPGDSTVWPAGVANAHSVENRSNAPARFLIAGTNPVNDTVHYPDIGHRREYSADGWRLVDETGAVIESGAF
ncbi:MAG: cupin domain-containing protein [Paracoccus sp. (in: a-proteobacteria)]